MELTIPNLVLREIKTTDHLSSLSLGKSEHTPLKTFLKRDALNFNNDHIAKTYVLVSKDDLPPSRVYGYLTLMCGQIDLGESIRQQKGKNFSRYKTFPAVKLARLAVDISL